MKLYYGTAVSLCVALVAQRRTEIADIFTAYNTRKLINERLKAQIKDLCPFLVKGAVEEGE